MSHSGLTSRLTKAAFAFSVAAMALTAPTSTLAQERPANLEELPAVPTTFTPGKTAWGDYDFTGIWPIEKLPNTRILFQRPKGYGMRFWQTDEEHASRLEAAQASDGSFGLTEAIGTTGTKGLSGWVATSDFAKRTSMLVSPADGQLPALTAKGQDLYDKGRSGWVPGQHYDWVDDFDSWDRCVSRGFPASMYPFRYNNGIRVFQSPGYIVIMLEMLGTRVIPIGDSVDSQPEGVEAWMGSSRAHWEGKTLVIETTNIVSGDLATEDVFKRSSSPLNMATQHVPPFNTIPMSNKAKTTERLTMTGPNAMIHELTYSDSEVYSEPWTTRIEWSRDQDYQFFEYACHEGNYMPRDYIKASQAHRQQLADGTAQEEFDQRAIFAQPFDRDPSAPAHPDDPGAGGFGPPPPAEEDE